VEWSPAGLLRTAAAAALGLPGPADRRVLVRRSIAVPARDGVVLRADLYRSDPSPAPTVLVRTPYPRGGPLRLICGAIAERGLNVLVASCRGTADSGGRFEPLVDEAADGVDTLRWLAGQPWHDGQVCTFGPSYAGFTQWALAVEAGHEITAMVTMMTASQFGASTHAGGAFALDAVLTWAALLAAQRASGPVERLGNEIELRRGQPRLHRGLAHLPLAEADRVATGAEITFYQTWLLEDDPDGRYWRARGHAGRLAAVRAPVFMVAGWYDIFLPWQLDDYATLAAAGATPRLTIGPWTHGSVDMYRATMAPALAWMREHSNGGPSGADRDRPPVRLYVGGVDAWRELDRWPPAGTVAEPWYLLPGAAIAPDSAPDSAPGGAPAGGPATPGAAAGGVAGRFRYDPADPTPAVGGPRLVGQVAGRMDNRDLERRGDVLTFTSRPLVADLEVIGPVTATVYLRSSLPFFDVFVRVCDVDASGRSWNLCDGLTRVTPRSAAPDPDGARAVPVTLWPTAHRFLPGHRLRVQVSGGAHPRYARNPGTGEALGAATALLPVEHAVLADPAHRSAVHLPTVR
jgi:putative CocE/NonD family hydrolase